MATGGRPLPGPRVQLRWHFLGLNQPSIYYSTLLTFFFRSFKWFTWCHIGEQESESDDSRAKWFHNQSLYIGVIKCSISCHIHYQPEEVWRAKKVDQTWQEVSCVSLSLSQYKGGGIGAAGAAMAAPLFSSNMGHALWPCLNWLSIWGARYGTDVYAHELMARWRTAAPMAPTC